MNGIVLPWLAEIGVLTWRVISGQKRPPLPSELLASFVIFGGFSLIPDERLRNVLAWGTVIATAFNAFNSNQLLLHPFNPAAPAQVLGTPAGSYPAGQPVPSHPTGVFPQ